MRTTRANSSYKKKMSAATDTTLTNLSELSNSHKMICKRANSLKLSEFLYDNDSVESRVKETAITEHLHNKGNNVSKPLTNPFLEAKLKYMLNHTPSKNNSNKVESYYGQPIINPWENNNITTYKI